MADFTYVRTWAGFVYVSFVIDCFSRSIVGWHASMSKQTPLVTTALRMGLWRRDRAGQPVGAGLVHHFATLRIPQRDYPVSWRKSRWQRGGRSCTRLASTEPPVHQRPDDYVLVACDALATKMTVTWALTEHGSGTTTIGELEIASGDLVDARHLYADLFVQTRSAGEHFIGSNAEAFRLRWHRFRKLAAILPLPL